MKKIILVSIFLLIEFCGYAQTEKGKMKIGGFFNLYSTGSKSERDSSFHMDQTSTYMQGMPEFGYFINDNLELGYQLIFGINNYEYLYSNGNNNYSDYKSSSKKKDYGFGIYARHYKKLADKFFFFINGSLSYTYENEKNISENININKEDISSNKFASKFYPGLSYFITPKLGFQVIFGNLYCELSSSTDKNISSENNKSEYNYGVNLNLSSFNLGLNYYFQRLLN